MVPHLVSVNIFDHPRQVGVRLSPGLERVAAAAAEHLRVGSYRGIEHECVAAHRDRSGVPDSDALHSLI